MLWGGTLLINLFVIGLVATIILHNRQRAFDEAAVISDNYARTLDENFAGFIRRVDMALLTVADEVTREKASGGIREKELEALLIRQDALIPEARGLRVMDAQGNIRYAVNGVNRRGANIGDRPYFIRVRDDPHAGLVFSEPVMGRASNVWVITLSRRISNPDGSFGGEVNVAIAVDRFSSMLALIELGPQGSASLWDKTHLIARNSRSASTKPKTGTPLPSPELRQLIAAGEKTGLYHITTTLDGIQRVFRFRQIGDYPIYLVVGLADDDFLAEWRKESLRLAYFAATFTLGTLIFAGLLHRSWRLRKRAEQQLLENEEKLVQLNATLDQRVRDEVAKNMEKEHLMIQQSRLAMMGSMIGNITHQWRQPLNALNLLLANIKDAYEFKELNQAMLDDMVQQCQNLTLKMSSTIDDFRDFFKPNKEKELFLLGQPIHEVLQLLGHSLKCHNINVEVSGDSSEEITGFPNEFSQVLLNIISNAKEAILNKDSQGGLIQIQLGHDAETAWVTVRDDGGGIPENILPRIFDPYFTTKETGSGIGLYMSKIIVEDHLNGKIEVRNIEGGAEFKLILPRNAAS